MTATPRPDNTATITCPAFTAPGQVRPDLPAPDHCMRCGLPAASHRPGSAVPSRDDAATVTCPVCQTRFTPAGRQQYCSSPCRKTAWRRRNTDPPPAVTVPAARPLRQHTVYQCPDCEQRRIGDQWCHDCNQPCRKIGYGAPCPHCDEPVAITDLTGPEVVIIPANR